MSCVLCVLLVWSNEVFVACSGSWILGRRCPSQVDVDCSLWTCAPLHGPVLHDKVDVDMFSVLDPCLSQCALVCMVLGILLGSTVICDGCPGPWILVHMVSVPR